MTAAFGLVVLHKSVAGPQAVPQLSRVTSSPDVSTTMLKTNDCWGGAAWIPRLRSSGFAGLLEVPKRIVECPLLHFQKTNGNKLGGANALRGSSAKVSNALNSAEQKLTRAREMSQKCEIYPLPIRRVRDGGLGKQLLPPLGGNHDSIPLLDHREPAAESPQDLLTAAASRLAFL